MECRKWATYHANRCTELIIKGHAGEIISISFNSDGDKILTGSFDYSAKVKKTKIDLGY